MRTIELTFVEPGIHEELIAHAAGNGSHFNNVEAEGVSWQSH